MALSQRESDALLDTFRSGRVTELTREREDEPDTPPPNDRPREPKPPASRIRIPQHRWGVTPWYRTAVGQIRLTIEQRLVREHFPTFEPLINNDGRLCWLGSMQPRDQEYVVAITCHASHLAGQVPSVEVLDPPLASDTPHRFNDNTLCVEHGDFGPHTPIVDVMGWTEQYLELYEDFLVTGRRW